MSTSWMHDLPEGRSGRRTAPALRAMGWAIAVALLLLPLTARAQSPVAWSARGPQASVRPGEKFTAQVAAKIDYGWHIYSITQPPGGPVATSIAMAAGQPFHFAGPVVGPKPQTAYDPNFEMKVETYEGSAAFALPIVASPAAPAGSHQIGIAVTFQACNDHLCLPPQTLHLEAPVKLAPKGPASGAAPRAQPAKPGAASAAPAAPTGTPPPSANGAAASSAGNPAGARRSLLSFLWLAALMGALSLLTPCVFPMVPITVSYFSKYASRSRRGAIAQSLAYGLGIVVTFSGLGLLLSLVFGAAGINRLAANPWVNLLITALFLVFALSLFELYVVRLPQGLVNRVASLGGKGTGGGYLGTVFMGLAFTLTSFTCTAPFLGTLFVLASRGSWRWPLAGMLAYSTAFALPFVVLAMAPQLLSQLPRSGTWMQSVKVVMGFLEIAAAMKFLSNADLVWHWGLFTRGTVLAIWIACSAAIVFYVLGFLRFGSEPRLQRVGALRWTTALAFLAVALLLARGFAGKPLGTLDSFLPPARVERGAAFAANSPSGRIPWILNDYRAALAQARREKELVFVDFTGYTCTNCRWMEANMFPQAAVHSRLEKFVCVRLYTDGAGPLYQGQQKMEQTDFGTVALPLYAIVRPDGSSVVTFEGLTRDAVQFVSFLDRGLAAGPPSTKGAS